MSNRKFTKSGKFLLVVLLPTIILAPFAAEQVCDVFGYKYVAWKSVRDLFSPSGGNIAVQTKHIQIEWKKQLADLNEFSEWAEGKPNVRIEIIRPEVFELCRVDANPLTKSECSWKMRLISSELKSSADEVKCQLELHCEPADGVSGHIASVTPLKGDEKGFLVAVDGIRGSGKLGLSYGKMLPDYYDVKLRRMWLVPVAGCRSRDLNGRYGSIVYFPGMKGGLTEGDVISPGSDKCGYRILSISDRCVWFEAFYGNAPGEGALPVCNWPDFSRIDVRPPTPPPGRLVFGRNRCFWQKDAIKLPRTNRYLYVDDFMGGKAVKFRLLDENKHQISDLLCVIVRER